MADPRYLVCTWGWRYGELSDFGVCGHAHRSEKAAIKCARSSVLSIFCVKVAQVIDLQTVEPVAVFSNKEIVSTRGSTMSCYSRVHEVPLDEVSPCS